MSKYAILQGNEDGDPFTIVGEINEGRPLSQVMEDYGIERWLTPEQYKQEPDPNYWVEGTALLMKVDIIFPKPVERVTEWSV